MTDADDAQTARWARREPLLHLLSRMQRGVLLDAERGLLSAAIRTEIEDGDQAHEARATGPDTGRIIGDISKKLLAEQAAHKQHRQQLADALDWPADVDWAAAIQRVSIILAAAEERHSLLTEARDALEAAGQTGAHGDDWPAIAPAIRALGAALDAAKRRAEAMTAAMESTAADALKHSGCHSKLMAQCLRAEKAEATVRDYENRLTWETTCGEHARLLDACAAADEAREQAEAALTRVRRLAGWAANGWSDLSPEKVLAALDGDQPAEAQADDGDRIVAYETVTGRLYCTRHGGGLLGVYRRTSDDLPDGGICHACGADVLAEPEHTCPDSEPCPIPGHDQPTPELATAVRAYLGVALPLVTHLARTLGITPPDPQ